MHPRLDKGEVISLAKTMEIKFTVSGPQIGGAKSGIAFDPNDSRKEGVLRRWYEAVTPLLKTYYGTGGDMNVDEIHEVIPITEDCGIWHPQEGVFNGHFKAKNTEKVKRIGHLRQGVSQVVEDVEFIPDDSTTTKYRVADLITGYGVSESVRHYYGTYGGSLGGKRVLVQGWGNVGAAAAFYLARAGAVIVGIIDRAGGIIRPDGLSLDEVTQLFQSKKGNSLHANDLLSFEEVNDQIWDLKADVFLPCAASRLVTQDQLDRMISAGVDVISSGANVPFADKEIFYGSIAESADVRIAVIPDFIANCGMARVFAYLMSDANVDMSDQGIFQDTSRTILQALEATHSVRSNKTLLAATAFQIALEKRLE
jgi:glutamate dehydrogenase/leucine dehydrogenase